MVPKLSFTCEPSARKSWAAKDSTFVRRFDSFFYVYDKQLHFTWISQVFSKHWNTELLSPETVSCLSSTHKHMNPVCRQSTAPLPLQVFAIFSIAFLCLIGFNSCVVNSSVLFCAGSGRKRSPAGLNVDSLNLAADFFLQFSRCTSALHIKAFPSWLLHCCGQFIRACTQKVLDYESS